MGGFGSGKCRSRRKAWRSKKLYTTSLLKLDVSQVMKLHKQNPGSSFTLGDVSVNVNEEFLHLSRDESEHLHFTSIDLALVACNYGGYRYFCYCPICNKRVKSLYLCKSMFACRHCLNLIYPSQNETLSLRLYKKSKKIKSKLDDREWTKPKWMRWATFEKLRNEYFNLENMHEVSDLLSLRNIFSAKAVLKKYGGAVFIPIEVVLTQSGRNWKLRTFNPNRLWKQIETKSKGRLTREHFINC
jgi:hypothetical protein